MNVLRIQDKAGFGPFCNGTYISGLGVYHNNDAKYPCTGTDFESIALPYRLGCPNACMYLYWFGLFIPELVENGYGLYKIQVKNYITGRSGKQCLYYTDDVEDKKQIW